MSVHKGCFSEATPELHGMKAGRERVGHSLGPRTDFDREYNQFLRQSQALFQDFN